MLVRLPVFAVPRRINKISVIITNPHRSAFRGYFVENCVEVKNFFPLSVSCASSRLFEANADLKAMFSGLIKHATTTAELRASKLLETHAMKVMSTIDESVCNLDDMDYVMKLLQMTAHAHCQRFPHFDADYFWVCLFVVHITACTEC